METGELAKGKSAGKSWDMTKKAQKNKMLILLYFSEVNFLK